MKGGQQTGRQGHGQVNGHSRVRSVTQRWYRVYLPSNLWSTSRTPPLPSIPVCVYMWAPSRLEALPGPRCSLSTLRFQRGSRALQQQAAHTARTGKDQEPEEDNLLHINTHLPVSCLSHYWFCFLAQDGFGSEGAHSTEVLGAGIEFLLPRLGPLSLPATVKR